MSKICGECINFDRSLNKCNKMQDDSIRATDTVLCCPFYELKPPTLFDRISESPETLAEKTVIPSFVSDEGYMAVLIPAIFKTKAEALSATIEKLKEVVE